MVTQAKQRSPRFVYGLRALLLLVAIVACALVAKAYRTKALRPNLTISAADVAWATDYKIWKIDLSDAGPVYGLQIVVFENGGKEKRWLVRSGGDSLLDTSKYPLVMISMKCTGGSVTGKLAHMGTGGFQASNLFQDEATTAWVGTPFRNGDLYYLMSDSPTLGMGKEPFEKGSNKIALELLRSPQKSP